MSFKIENMEIEKFNIFIDFDSFAMMMCFKTMELEPEIVLLEALSKWDERIQGVISLER